MCPSETNDRPMMDSDRPIRYPLNYAVNLGTWYVHDECASRPGPGAFAPRKGLRPQDITDGESLTVAFAEVKAHTPCFRNAGLVHPPEPTPGDVAAMGGDFFAEGSHTQWVDGRVHETGFTATFTPNTKVRHVVEGREFKVQPKMSPDEIQELIRQHIIEAGHQRS